MCNLVDGSCLPIFVPDHGPLPILRSVAEVVAQYAGAAIERLLGGIPGLF